MLGSETDGRASAGRPRSCGLDAPLYQTEREVGATRKEDRIVAPHDVGEVRASPGLRRAERSPALRMAKRLYSSHT